MLCKLHILSALFDDIIHWFKVKNNSIQLYISHSPVISSISRSSQQVIGVSAFFNNDVYNYYLNNVLDLLRSVTP